jgi:hypothetical protein
MCEQCVIRDNQIKSEVGIHNPHGSAVENEVAELVNQLHADTVAIDRRSYFVSYLPSVIDTKQKLIDAGLDEIAAREKLCEVMQSTIAEMKQRILEAQGISIAAQRLLNIEVPKLREEIRERFKSFDITYKPAAVVAPVKISGPRISAAQRSKESAAAVLGVSPEVYTRALEQALKSVTGMKCTCSETPGICRVHPK